MDSSNPPTGSSDVDAASPTHAHNIERSLELVAPPVAKVVKMPINGTGQASSGPVRLVDAYWHGLRGPRIVPSRTDVDPRGIEGALSHAFILERIAPGHGRIRIAGTHMGDLLGMEVRGMPLSALFEPDARSQVQAALRCVFDDPAIYRLELKSEARIGKPELTAELALYPLRNEMGDITRALGVIDAKGLIGRAPRRFAISKGSRHKLHVPDKPNPNLQADSDASDADTTAKFDGFAEPETRFMNTAIPYLRVVNNNT
ncbi:MAG: PAS domain-containing protein [Marinovum sp.]|nr:PAS domain-containing protein [Marinovum sp.]